LGIKGPEDNPKENMYEVENFCQENYRNFLAECIEEGTGIAHRKDGPSLNEVEEIDGMKP
jgi:hypothetical protein